MNKSESERFEQLEELFSEALRRAPGAERVGYLDAACAGDAALRREVESLLAAAEGPGPIDVAASAVVRPLLAALKQEEPIAGARIGPYVLVREVGRGGMGIVYLARRDDAELPQRVALKLVRGGLDNPELRRRFTHERRIAARLEHPNIARLLDGGVTDEGEPYYALEYVEGEPIDRFCDKNRLDISRRLRLFLDVCSAVEYAHGNLVVHRDLKPSNILVSADGRVKLLDFGIAKLLDAPSNDSERAFTRTGARPMTPRYASPEQVRCEPVTTSTDVYSLGVVLYELLTGRLPYRRSGGLAHEIERAICEEEPERPSAATTRDNVATRATPPHASETATPSAVTAASVAAARSTRPDVLRRRLSGDLDAVALKALAKEATRRYSSVEQLREDIERHLAGLPVRAHAPTLAYRSMKLVGRHRVAAAACLASFIAAAGFVVTLWTYSARLEVERDRARVEAMKTAQVSDFLVGLFDLPELEEGMGDTLSARVALDRGARRLLDDDGVATSLEPGVRTAMLHVLGRAYYGLGLRDDAVALLEKSLAFGSANADPSQSAESMMLLGDTHRLHGRPAEAVRLFTDALALLEADSGRTRLADALHGLALSLRRLPDMRDSATVVALREAAVRADAQGTDHPDYALALGTLSYMTGEAADREAAVVAYRAALERLRRDGAPRADLATALHNLGYMLRRTGDPAAAEPLYREALDLYVSIDGEAHPRTISTIRHLASALQEVAAYDDARALIERWLDIERRERGPRHWRTAYAAAALGSFYADLGDRERAVAWLRDAREIMAEAFGEADDRTAVAASDLGQALHRAGRFGEAERELRVAHAALQAAAGEDDPRTRTAAGRLTSLCKEWPCAADMPRR